MQKNDPFAALRYPEFRYFITAQFIFTVAILAQEFALGFYIWDLTHRKILMGLVGLFEAIPYISIALFGGYFADKYDKKKIYQIAYLVILVCSVILFLIIDKNIAVNTRLIIIYTVILILGFARGFYGPAWASLKPFLVKSEHYSNSASWSSQFWQTGMILGPILGGILYYEIKIANTLLFVAILMAIVLVISSLISTKNIPRNTSTANVFQSLKEGIAFVRTNRILWYAILLDMFSVLFGGVVAMLPVYAEEILKISSKEAGLLRAAVGLGAVLTMLGTAFITPTKRPWRNMLIAVLGFGVATLVFAISKNYYLSCIALFLTGAFDSISVVVRQTILQVLPPDEMRGRVSSVNGIFVSCSNELGAFESGLAAELMGTVPSVVFGGTMTLVIVAVIYLRTPELFAVRLIPKSEKV
jgi:MFS family permease